MKLKARFLFFMTGIIMLSSSHAQNSETVKIYQQVWASKNLDVTVFKNGDPIPEAKTNAEWMDAAANNKPAWCYYNNDPANAKYGKLYNGFVLEDSRGLMMDGWHIATAPEWGTLIANFGSNDMAGTYLKSKTGWLDEGNGDNRSGFNALPGGYRGSKGTFNGLGKYGNWWTYHWQNDQDLLNIPSFQMTSLSMGVEEKSSSRANGFSIRLVKD